MGVDVDGLDAFTADRDRQLLTGWLLGMRALQQAAAAEDNAGSGCGSAGFQKITACGHDDFLPGCFLPAGFAPVRIGRAA
jgi:hypothetical protein